MKKYLNIIMTLLICLTHLTIPVLASTEYLYSFSELGIKEYNDLIVFNYEQEENGKIYRYEEILSGNHVHTKKYEKDKLINEFDSYIKVDQSKNISVKVVNEKMGTTEIIEVTKDMRSENEDIGVRAVVPNGRKHHPYDNEYYFNGSSSGHLGFRNLTRAVIVGALSSLVSKGNIIIGSIGAAATLIAEKGFRNVYYTEESYYPYGMDMKGRPIWKKITYLYAGNDRSHLIETIYTDADLVVTYWLGILELL